MSEEPRTSSVPNYELKSQSAMSSIRLQAQQCVDQRVDLFASVVERQ
jgi:hypothetical protein